MLGIVVFTLILLMGRLIKLTEMVISKGVPFEDVARMIGCLMPSFLVFTLPMAFLLAVLLAFGRLSSDNEITVMKAGGISLIQLMPPVLLCAIVTTSLALVTSIYGVPWGNSSFKQLSFQILKQNVAATIREKVFWDDMPGIVLYADHYDENTRRLTDVLIHDGRDAQKPLTIFARDGLIGGVAGSDDARIVLYNGSIHKAGTKDEYHLVNFTEYLMTISRQNSGAGIGLNELDMSLSELERQMQSPATAKPVRLKMAAEYHSRFALPFASLVFAVLAMPLGIQNRRSGKSVGFSLSIAILLAYYILMSLMKTMVEKGAVPAIIGLWTPNYDFSGCRLVLLRMASQERSLSLPSPRCS